MTKVENSRLYEKDASSPSSRCLGVKIAPEMRSQDRNYMPEVVSHVSLSYGKVFIFKLQLLQKATM